MHAARIEDKGSCRSLSHSDAFPNTDSSEKDGDSDGDFFVNECVAVADSQFHDESLRVSPADAATEKSSPRCANTLAGIAGNVLEWYDFSVFGFLSDVIGEVFFPAHQTGHLAITESFLIFGGAFLMRPVGGIFMGYIGDKYGRQKALRVSIFLMAFPTFAMGCLPSYERAGSISIVLLVIVRLLQGFSVGGQLVSSAVFTLENNDRKHWGYYGSLVMAAANFGTLLGSFAGWGLRSSLSAEQLSSWGWRLPFLSGILVSISGLYLGAEEEKGLHHQETSTMHADGESVDSQMPRPNPIKVAFAPHNRRSLLASTLVPMLWSSGFYLSFVWMAIFMTDLSNHPIDGSFGVNATALFFSVCLLFPVMGSLSDRYGRRTVMTIGAVFMGSGTPLLIMVIGQGNTLLALISQTIIGVSLSCFGAPMVAWLVESFEAEARLTSVAIGYNLAQATVGGLTPALATLMVDVMGPSSPGLLLFFVSLLALLGLWVVTPPVGHQRVPSVLPVEGISNRSSGEGIVDPFQHPISRRRKANVFSALPRNDRDVSGGPDNIELV